MTQYRAIVASPALRNGQASHRWQVPIELALAAAAPPAAIKGVIMMRYAKGLAPLPACTVFALDGQLFATVEYPGREPSLLIPLDVHLWDHRDAGHGGFTPQDLERLR